MSIHKQTYETGPPLEPVIHWCFRCAQLLFDTIHTCIGCDIESGVRLYRAEIVHVRYNTTDTEPKTYKQTWGS